MEKATYHFVLSQKGGQILVDNNENRYVYVKESSKKKTYKCKAQNCKTCAYIKKPDQSFSLSTDHNHGRLLQTTKSILQTHKKHAAANPDISTRNVLRMENVMHLFNL